MVMAENEITSSTIRKKAGKATDPYTAEEIVEIWSYLEKLEGLVQNDPANELSSLEPGFEDMTKNEGKDHITATKNIFKDVGSERYESLKNVDLSKYTNEELQSLKSFISWLPGSKYNDIIRAVADKIKIREDQLQAESNERVSLDNIAEEDTKDTSAEIYDENNANDDASYQDNEGGVGGNDDENHEENSSNEESLDDYNEWFESYYGLDKLKDKNMANETVVDELNNDLSCIFPNENADSNYSDEKLFENNDFKNIKALWDNINIITEDKKPISNADKEYYWKLFLEQTRNEAAMYHVNNVQNVDDARQEQNEDNYRYEKFSNEYRDRLQLNLLLLIGAERMSKSSLQEVNEYFNDIVVGGNALSVDISLDTYIGYQAAKQEMLDKASKVMSGYLGEIPNDKKGIKGFFDKIQKTNKNLETKFGKKYSLVKGALKSAGWGAAYSTAGALAGPAGIAAVATVSLANQAYGMYKDYKSQKKQIEGRRRAGENVKKLSFGTYLSQNKMRVAGMLLTTATAAMGVAGNMGIDTSTVQAMKTGAGIAMASGGAFHQAAQAYKNAPKGKKMAAAKAFGASVLSFAAGYFAGHAAGEYISNDSNVPVDNSANAANLGSTPEQTTPEVAPENTGSTPEQITPEVVAGNDGADTTTDTTTTYATVENTIDLNNLTPEQQHDLKMLFLRDPAEANDILGNTGKDWMNSHELQEAWNDGTISDEQKQALVEFAGERFDERGNFVDIEGRALASDMESAAKEWDNRHASVSEEYKVKPLDPYKPSLVIEVPTINSEDIHIDDAHIEQVPTPDMAHSNVQVDEQGNISAAYLRQDGATVHMTVTANGELKALSVDAHGDKPAYAYSEAQLKFINGSQAGRDMVKGWHSDLLAAHHEATAENAPSSSLDSARITEVTPSQYSDVKVDSNGAVSGCYTTENGVTYKVDYDNTGKVTGFTFDDHIFSQKELATANNNPEFREQTEQWRQAMLACCNGAESTNTPNTHVNEGPNKTDLALIRALNRGR